MEFNAKQLRKSLDGLREGGYAALADDLESRIRKEVRSRDSEIARLRAMMPARSVVRADPDQKGGKFEASPPKSALEHVLSRLSVCTTTREPTGATSQAEITEAEFAGMIAGMPIRGGDRLLRELAELVAWAYLGYPNAMGRLIDHLDTWGRQRVLFRYPELRVTGSGHKRVAKVVAQRHIQRDLVKVEDMRRSAGLSERRWPQWRDWVSDLSRRVADADSALAGHLWEQLFAEELLDDYLNPTRRKTPVASA